MIKSKIKKIIVKYITKNASAKDIEILTKWIQDSDNKRIFNEYIKLNYELNYSLTESQPDAILKELLPKIRSEKSLRLKLRRKRIIEYAVAAIIVSVIAVSFYIKMSAPIDNENSIIVTNNNIEPGDNKATLTLEDGTNIKLEEGLSFQTKKIQSNGTEIIYKGEDDERGGIKYNYLTIPRGGQFFVQLSDGTKVWLNSETQLKYPVSFASNSPRQVELIYGEVYFEVTSSEQNHGNKFSVLSYNQEIEVLGTKFNIKAYKNQDKIYTTLKEGKVAIDVSQSQVLLNPGHQSIVGKNTNHLTVIPVEVEDQIAWVRGEYILKNESLKDIMKVLSRWYDMEVKFENMEVQNETFYGKIRRDQKITDILNRIKEFGILNGYEINNNTVILK